MKMKFDYFYFSVFNLEVKATEIFNREKYGREGETNNQIVGKH